MRTEMGVPIATRTAPDDRDIAAGTSDDCDADGIPDECERDEDNDGVVDDCDSCPGTFSGLLVDDDGCPVPVGPCCFAQGICVEGTSADDCTRVLGRYVGDGLTCNADPDLDGVVGCNDSCPLDRKKTAPGSCGCGVPEGDRDGDGVCDAVDRCPLDNPDDSDGDGVCDSADPCPFDDPDDADADGICNSDDGCPNDPAKSEPGACGCGVPDDDGDRWMGSQIASTCVRTRPPMCPRTVRLHGVGACCFSVGVCSTGWPRRMHGDRRSLPKRPLRLLGRVDSATSIGTALLTCVISVCSSFCFTGVSGEFSEQSCVAAD